MYLYNKQYSSLLLAADTEVRQQEQIARAARLRANTVLVRQHAYINIVLAKCLRAMLAYSVYPEQIEGKTDDATLNLSSQHVSSPARLQVNVERVFLFA